MAVKFRERDGSWFYRFEVDGQRYQEYGFPTAKEARDAERGKIKDIESGKKAVSKDVRNATFSEAAKSFYDNYANTLDHEKDYRCRLPIICKAPSMQKRVLDITKQDIRDLRAHLKKTLMVQKWDASLQAVVEVPVSVRTVNHYHAHVRAVINWWKDEHELAFVNVADLVDLEKVPEKAVRFLYPAEEKLLTPVVLAHPWMFPYYFTALETGLREANLCAIKAQHVDLILGRIFIADSKNGASGTIPISDRLRPWLARWTEGKLPEQQVLGSYTANSVSNEFCKIVRSVGLPDFTFHCLRHTFATYHLLRGESTEHVSKLLLQKDPRVTERHYNGVLAIHLKDVVDGGQGIVSVESPSPTPNATPHRSFGVAEDARMIASQ